MPTLAGVDAEVQLGRRRLGQAGRGSRSQLGGDSSRAEKPAQPVHIAQFAIIQAQRAGSRLRYPFEQRAGEGRNGEFRLANSEMMGASAGDRSTAHLAAMSAFEAFLDFAHLMQRGDF